MSSAHPRETMPRFILAMIAILVGATAVAESLWFSVYKSSARHMVLDLCPPQAQTQSLCTAAQRSRIEWTIMFVPLVVVVAAAVALIASLVRRRRLSLVPAGPATPFALVNEASAASVDTTAAPLLWRPDRPVLTARADGLVQRYVEVGPGWLTMTIGDPQRAAAILRHEYAHHRNRDVIVARLTAAASAVFVVLVVWLVVAFRDAGTRVLLAAIAHGAVLVLIASLARSSVLRAREFDADLTAAEAHLDGMARALESEATVGPAWRSRIRAPFAHHPSPARRRAVVDNPGLLDQPKLADAALVGLTAGVGAPVIARLLADWARTGNLSVYSAAISWAAIGVVLGCWLTVMMWGAAAQAAQHGTRPHLLGFGVVLGASLLLGNVVFTGALLDDAIVIPKHTTDILSSLILACVMPLGVIWLTELLQRIFGRWPRATAFRGIGAIGALFAVATIAALLAAVGFLHAQAVFIGDNAAPFRSAGTDANLPLTIVSIAQVWNHEWMGYALPALALLGGLFCLARRPQPVWPLVPIGAGLFGAGVLWAVREGFDIIHHALDAGWFASLQTAYVSPAIVGVTISATIGVCLLGVRESPVVLAAAFAAVASVVAAVFLSVVVLPGDDDLWALVRDIALVAVIGSMLFAAISSRGSTSPRSRLAWGGLAVLVTAATTFAGVTSASAKAPAVIDRAHYQQVLDAELAPEAPLLPLLAQCEGHDFDPSAADSLRVEQRALSNPFYRPSTAALQAVHENLVELTRLCADAAARAVDGEATTEEQWAAITERINTFVSDYTKLNPGG